MLHSTLKVIRFFLPQILFTIIGCTIGFVAGLFISAGMFSEAFSSGQGITAARVPNGIPIILAIFSSPIIIFSLAGTYAGFGFSLVVSWFSIAIKSFREWKSIYIIKKLAASGFIIVSIIGFGFYGSSELDLASILEYSFTMYISITLALQLALLGVPIWLYTSYISGNNITLKQWIDSSDSSVKTLFWVTLFSSIIFAWLWFVFYLFVPLLPFILTFNIFLGIKLFRKNHQNYGILLATILQFIPFVLLIYIILLPDQASDINNTHSLAK